jgi:hypothetical protein
MYSRGMLIHCPSRVRQLPFWLLNSCVVTECPQRGHLNVLKPCIVVTV